ncbi:MAG TPA: hypothetical protein VHO24_18615 [Opitutaceae bacterium]|nr:hypothetical protein [Opitutaceae bacterium]
MIIRLQVPWYEPFEVDTKYFGKFRIQLASVSVEGSSIIQIAAIPVKTKESLRGSAARESFGLSGAFETQEQAISAWDTGFVVLSPAPLELPGVRDTLIKALLKKRQAQELKVA